MSQNDAPEQPKSPPVSKISNVFGPIRLLPGESLDAYKDGLAATINELGASTHLQIYLAEKIFQCLWWMRRYEIQKHAAAINAMVDLLTKYDTPKSQKHALTVLLEAQRWSDAGLEKIISGVGHTPESLLAMALSKRSDEIQKLDVLIALRVKTLGQLQQSYEALVNRSVMAERLKLQNELIKRDLQAIDVPVLQSITRSKAKGHDNTKTESGK